jgi:hypothetical protein
MDLRERLVVGGSDDAGQDLWLARDLPLDPGQHVHILEQDEVPVALAKGVHVLVLVDGSSQAGEMNAVNEGDSPVLAFTSRRYARALVTSTSSKPCIIGL